LNFSPSQFSNLIRPKELNDIIKTFSIDERTRGHCRERMLSLIFGGAYQGEHNERT
jgi:hypothetical protein